MTTRRIRFVIAAITIVVLAVGGWYVFQITQTPSVSIPQSKRYWIISTPALNDLMANTSTRNVIAADTIFVPIKKSEQLAPATAGLHIIPTETFTSEAALASALSSSAILPSTKAILYDNEDWSLTPTEEQSQPAVYYRKAASLVHAKGYIFIGTPVSKSDPQIDTEIASYVDVLDIQSQYDQSTSSAYAGHVLPIARDAHATNPSLIILSGLSTNPPAGIPTADQLVNDARSVQPTIQGYWLNIPAPGTACPKCHQPQPQIGIDLLLQLGAV